MLLSRFLHWFFGLCVNNIVEKMRMNFHDSFKEVGLGISRLDVGSYLNYGVWYISTRT